MLDKTWKIEKHKVGNGAQELQVAILVREMESVFSSYSESWCNMFTGYLKDIPRSNIFSAENGFKAFPIDTYSLEVWKMKVNGDKAYKMFTVTKIR